jgi:WD40 repeat protein
MRQLEETLLLLAEQDPLADTEDLVRRIERSLSEEDVPVVAGDGRRIMQTIDKAPPTTEPGPQMKPLAFVVAAVAVLIAIALPAWLLGGSGPEDVVAELSLHAPATGNEVHTLEGAIERTAAVAWSPDGTLLVTAIDGEAIVWDAVTGTRLDLQELDHIPDVTDVAWTSQGVAVSGGEEREAYGIYDPDTGEKVRDLPYGGLASSPDGTRGVEGGAWGWAAIVDAATGEYLIEFPHAPTWVFAAAWSPDGSQLATTWGPGIKVWNATTGEEQLTIWGPGKKVWDTLTGEEQQLSDLTLKVTDLAWSPDGTRIAMVSRFGAGVHVFDAATGEEMLTFSRNSGGIWAVIWSPNSSRIATAGMDGTATIWDAGSGDELATLTGHTAKVTDLAWSPDGARLATASEDGTVKVWQAR